MSGTFLFAKKSKKIRVWRTKFKTKFQKNLERANWKENAAVNQITGGLTGVGAGFGTTFQTQLSNLSKSLLSSAKIIAVGIKDWKKHYGIGYLE